MRSLPDSVADRLLRRCVAVSVFCHLAGFGAAIPLARNHTVANHPLAITFIDLKEPIKTALNQIEEEKKQPPIKPRYRNPNPRPRSIRRSALAPVRTPRVSVVKPRVTTPEPSADKPDASEESTPSEIQDQSAETTEEPKVAEAPEVKPAEPPTPEQGPGVEATVETPRESPLPSSPHVAAPGPRLAALPQGPSKQPDELPGGGSKGASLQGKMLPRAPGPKPLDTNNSGGAKGAPGGQGTEEQTPMPRGLPIGKKEANLPFNPNLTTMGGGRSSGLSEELASGGGPVDRHRRKSETVFLGGGGGGRNLPKALPRIGGGGGAPTIVASNSPRATDSVRSGDGGWGPGTGGGVGYGTGKGIGFSRGPGIGVTGGKVPVGVLHPGIGRGIGAGDGDGIGTGSASRSGRGEAGPGTGKGAGYGYGRGNGIGIGDGGGGSKWRPRFVGIPFGVPGGMISGRGKGGGNAGNGPGGPGFGITAAGRGRGNGGGGEGGIGAGYGGGIGFGRGGGGAGGSGIGLGTGIGSGAGGGGRGSGGDRPGLGGRGGPGLGKATPGSGGGSGGGGMALTRGFLGGGLKGAYYDDPKRKPGDYIVVDNRPAEGQPITWSTFTSLRFTQTDEQIRFYWNSKEPKELDPRSPEAAEYIKEKMAKAGKGVGPSYFSVRWTGKFYAPNDGEYTFYLDDLDDGGRLWIDGNLIIDRWLIQRFDANSHPIHLTRGIHDIRVDYCQGPEWLDSIVLRWKGPGFDKEVMGPAKRVRRKQ